MNGVLTGDYLHLTHMNKYNYERNNLNKSKNMDYKAIATELWSLLDDIDTASDGFKPCEDNGINSYENFYGYTMRKVSARHKLLKSDGYKLYSNEDFLKLPKLKEQQPVK